MVKPITAIPQSQVPASVLVRVSIAVKIHHDQGNSSKRKQLIVVTSIEFSGSVHYHHDLKQDNMPVDMALEMYLRVLTS